MLDFKKLTWQEFEALSHEIVLEEHPDVNKTANPDGGADTVLLRRVPERGSRVWQAKHFKAAIHWAQCEESLTSGIETYRPARYTFIFSKDLTANEIKQFQTRLTDLGAKCGVLVDYRDASWVEKRVHSSLDPNLEERFFASTFPPTISKQLSRALRAQGELFTIGHAISRGFSLGDFLDAQDPFYEYSLVIGPTSHTDDRSHSLTLHLENEGQLMSIAAFPRDASVMKRRPPKIKLNVDLTGDEGALRQEISNALEYGGKLELGERATLTHVDFPRVFQNHYEERAKDGQSSRSAISLSITPPSLRVCLASSDDEASGVEVELFRTPPPANWDWAFSGTDESGRLQLDWQGRKDSQGTSRSCTTVLKHLRGTAPATDHVTALRWLQSFVRSGQLRIVHSASREILFAQSTVADQDDAAVVAQNLEIYEALAEIEKWSGARIAVPDNPTEQDLSALVETAEILRSRRLKFTFSEVRLVRDPGISHVNTAPPSEAAVLIEEPFIADIFSSRLTLGRMRLPLGDCKISRVLDEESHGESLLVTSLDGDQRVIEGVLLDDQLSVAA